MTIHEQIRTLANPVRLEILEVLKAGGQMPASEIISHLKESVSAPMLSQHLSKLRLNNLILSTSWEGRPRYRLNQKVIDSVLHRLEALGK